MKINWDSYPFVPELRFYLSLIRNQVNTWCKNTEPCLLIIYSVVFVLLVVFLHNWVVSLRDSKSLLQRTLFFLRNLPIIRTIVGKKIQEVRDQIYNEQVHHLQGEKYVCELPVKGLTPDEVVSQVKCYQSMGKVEWENGKVSGAVYAAKNPEFYDMITRVYNETAYTNPLHSDIFPGIRKMEAEIVRMCCSLFNGGGTSCGVVSTGGTESIFLACKAYRDYAINEKGICHPEMVIPRTAHAAFEKSASILGMRLKFIPVDPKTMKVDVCAMKKAITRNTCMLVGSAPQFPHGIIDPISEIGQLGQKYDIPVHVDCCLGGFLVPFVKDAGYEIPPCDFTVPGVTSISADTHKYGYSPKGSSVVMYSDPKYLRYQFFVQTDWPGGVYASPSLSGSRAGCSISTCWAAMLYHGREGYVQATKKILDTTHYIYKRICKIPGLIVYGEPQLSVIAVGSKEFDIFMLNDLLTERGWNLNSLQYPQGFHLCVTQRHTEVGVADQFLSDLKECTETLMKNPSAPAKGRAAIYGMAQSIPDRSIISELACAFLETYYFTSPSGTVTKENSSD